MSISDFQILSKLGDGSYSCVYKVKRLEDGQEYALKKVKMLNLSDREKENALNEVRILASIKHKNVASYKQAFFDEQSSSLCIVMEYADNGDVFQKICEHQQQGTFMKEKVIWKVIIQSVRGLKALHDLKILHRDMKSANIFLWKDYTAKLGDLNVSKVAKKGLLYTQTGTPYYASPEVWKDQPYDSKSDIWSLGCVIYEMCSLVPPFRADDMNGLFKRILKGQYPPIPAHYSMELRQVIRNLIQVNPQARPSCDQILDNPIIQKRTKKYFKEEQTLRETLDSESELLKTIKISQNIFKLKLPQPNYEQLNFATMPAHHVKYQQNLSKNSRNVLQSKALTQAQPQSNANSLSKGNLPKINSNSYVKLAQPSQQVIAGAPEESGKNEEDYEQDFENPENENEEEKKQLKQNTKPKSRSYSGRKDVEIRGKQPPKPQRSSILQTEQAAENLPIITQRSKQSEDLISQSHSITRSVLKNDRKSPTQNQLTASNSSNVLQNNDPNLPQPSINILKPSKQLSKVQSNNDNSIIQKSIEEKVKEENEETKAIKKIVQRKVVPKSQQQMLIEQNGDKTTTTTRKLKNDISASIIEDQSLLKLKEEKSLNYSNINHKNQLSQSPSGMSLDVSLISNNINNKSILTQQQQVLSKKSLQQYQNQPTNITNQQSVASGQQNKQSPNFKRIFNIYSNNASKKKKYVPQPVLNQQSNIANQNSSNAYRDDLQEKMKKLYEKDRSQSIETNLSNNSNLLLPELKSITPQLNNIKNHYSIVNNGSYSNNNPSLQKLMNRKKSYERLMRLDQQLYNLYKNQGLNYQPKVESSQSRVHNIYGGGKQGNKGYYLGGGNYSLLGLNSSELDIQGKSMISKHSLNNSYL